MGRKYVTFKVVFCLVCLFFFFENIFAQNTVELKLEIYSKLRDRSCTTMTLAQCNCPEAKEMKAYIDALIETGVSKEEIFYKVARKFSLNTILDAKIKGKVEQRLINEAGLKRPQIIIEPTTFNFGQVSKKQGKISKVFKLANKGDSILAISSIKVFCPCTFVSLNVGKNKTPYFGTEGVPQNWQFEIKPAQSGKLELMLDLASPHINIGKVTREVLIISNDPIYPEVGVRVEAEVSE